MGIEVLADLETNRGPTKKLFVRIDSFKVNMTINEIKFTTTSWLDKTFGDKFLRKYFTDDLKPAVGLTNGKYIYYPDAKSEGVDIELQNLFVVPMYREKEVVEPIYEMQDVTKEVPYVSFDENGDEITLYRTVNTQKKVQIDEKKTTKLVVDYDIINNLGEYCYEKLASILAEVFGEDKIKIVK